MEETTKTDNTTHYKGKEKIRNVLWERSKLEYSCFNVMYALNLLRSFRTFPFFKKLTYCLVLYLYMAKCMCTSL